MSEPKREALADAMHWIKLSFTKRFHASMRSTGPFWQPRGYDRNVRSAEEFAATLDYVHENPVKRGLVRNAAEWKWSSFRHYVFREVGVVEIESEWTARDRETRAVGGPPRIFLPVPDLTS